MEDTAEPDLQVRITDEDGATVVAVSGELDAASTADLQGPLNDVSARASAVVLDLTDCQFVDSTGLHAIIDARGAIEQHGGRFALCCVADGPVARVIEVALPGMIELYPTRAAALQSLQ
jgi:anti-sigma B factor antagonist